MGAHDAAQASESRPGRRPGARGAPGRRRGSSRHRLRRAAAVPALALAGCLLAAGCATAPPAPPPAVDPPVEPEGSERDARSVVRPRVEARRPPAPPPPWLEPSIRWEPEGPREGTATTVWIEVPSAGRRPEGVSARLGGREIPLLATETGWFGVAAVPIGAEGTEELVARFRLGPDSAAEARRRLWVREREFPAIRLRVASRFAGTASEELLERVREERERIRAVLSSVTPAWLPTAPFDWPRPPRITSPFGQRRLFNGQLRSRHTGLDLGGGTGAPVRAAADGRVALVGDFFYQGNAVYVDHGLGVYTGYFHLSRADVAIGDTVTRGQAIGRVGATGRVTGPHLHWSAYVGGVTVDPASLLEVGMPGPEEAPGVGARVEVPVAGARLDGPAASGDGRADGGRAYGGRP